jgi:hypothetical protein
VTHAQYKHTQPGWPIRLGFGAAALLFMTLGTLHPSRSATLPRLLFWLGPAFALALGFLWSSLTVRIDSEALHVWFVPGWPKTAVKLTDIAALEVTRTTFWNGWGLHRTRRGWLYNVAGYDAVVVTRKDGRSVLVGTDEPRRLKAALERALAGSGKR